MDDSDDKKETLHFKSFLEKLIKIKEEDEKRRELTSYGTMNYEDPDFDILWRKFVKLEHPYVKRLKRHQDAVLSLYSPNGIDG